VAAFVLDRLDVLADREDFGEKAEATLNLFASQGAQYGLFAATYGLALLHHLRAPTDVVVVGEPGDERTRTLLRAGYDAPHAGKRVFVFAPDVVKSRDLPAGLVATLPALPFDGVPLALVCKGTACYPPVQTPEALCELLTPAKPA
jgi:uncharacterized protein YyaL (SSP411 family)